MKRLSRLFYAVLLFVAVSAQSEIAPPYASLDAEHSSVSFVSVKNKDISEVHTFGSIRGSISAAGTVQVSIDATSLDTGIQIRDERMREHLFAVADFPSIDIQAQVDLATLKLGAQRLQLPATLTLVGKQLDIQLDVLVVSTESGLTVSSVKPVVIYAAQAGLTAGIDKLAELANVRIGLSTPVSFALSFKHEL